MSLSNITSQIFSTLGNNTSSLVPLAIKDTASSLGTVYYFNKNGDKKHDGRERAIEEFGTEAVWLFGIPAFKKVFDWAAKNVKKFKGISPEIDPRIIKDQKYFDWAIKNADEKSKELLENVKNNKGAFKQLSMARFIGSTAFTLLALGGIIWYKQKSTCEKIEKEFKKETEQQNAQLKTKNNDFDTLGAPINFGWNKSKNVSFGSASNIIDTFVTNPLCNQIILDGGITGLRSYMARKGELGETLLKEATIIGMIYGGGIAIEYTINKVAKFFGLPIALNNKTLDEAEELIASIKNKTLEKDLKEFNKKTPEEILEFIAKNEDNMVVKTAKKSGIISTLKDGKTIDTTKFIDTKDLKKVASNLEDVLNASLKKTNIEGFFKKLKFAKRTSILANLGIGVGFLAVLQPKLLLLYRKAVNGSVENPGAKQYEKELKEAAFKGKTNKI